MTVSKRYVHPSSEAYERAMERMMTEHIGQVSTLSITSVPRVFSKGFNGFHGSRMRLIVSLSRSPLVELSLPLFLDPGGDFAEETLPPAASSSRPC